MDSFFKAEKMIKEYGAKKALQRANYYLWHVAKTNTEKAYQRAVMYYIEKTGDRKRMIVTVMRDANKFKKKSKA